MDELLCFGWIDGVRRSVDEVSYAQRITPRRKGSIWSFVNIKRARELIEEGKMMPSGLAAFERRDPAKSGQYSFERGNVALDPSDEATFRANPEAWTFFESQPPSYRKAAIGWVTSAKKDATRTRRLDAVIDDSRSGRRVAPFRRP